jgi:hypothetical protein
LHSGKTVIQHIYDSHYEGAARAADYVKYWQSLKGEIDDERYAAVFARLEYQSGHAIVWRDAICEYFFRLSGIADRENRVGHHRGRIEAESMQLTGYTPVAVTPWENASGGEAIECAPQQSQSCSAKFAFNGITGQHEIDVQYFDTNNGDAKYRLYVGNKLVDEWLANDHLPTTRIGGDSSTRHRILGIMLHPHDEIRMEGFPDHDENAAVDYIEIVPQRHWRPIIAGPDCGRIWPVSAEVSAATAPIAHRRVPRRLPICISQRKSVQLNPASLASVQENCARLGVHLKASLQHQSNSRLREMTGFLISDTRSGT